MKKGGILDYILVLAFVSFVAISTLEVLTEEFIKTTKKIDNTMCHITDTCILIVDNKKDNKHAR